MNLRKALQKVPKEDVQRRTIGTRTDVEIPGTRSQKINRSLTQIFPDTNGVRVGIYVDRENHLYQSKGREFDSSASYQALRSELRRHGLEPIVSYRDNPHPASWFEGSYETEPAGGDSAHLPTLVETVYQHTRGGEDLPIVGPFPSVPSLED